MTTHTNPKFGRYFVKENTNTLDLVDGRTGKTVEDTSLWLLNGETYDDRFERHQQLEAKCGELNRAEERHG